MSKLLKNFALIIIILLFGELLFRVIFPELTGKICAKNIIHGKKLYTAQPDYGKFLLREPAKGVKEKLRSSSIILCGDSVTLGVGLAYEDLYWSYWQRMFELENRDISIIAPEGVGNNFVNNINSIKEIFENLKGKTHIEGVVYQFNYNDILPYSNEQIKKMKDIQALKWSFLRSVHEFKWAVLYQSTMLRIIFENADILKNKLPGFLRNIICVEPVHRYTYVFGMKGYEAGSERLWKEFESNLESLHKRLGDTPIVIIVSPIMQTIDPDMRVHTYSLIPKEEMSKATINPIERLKRICSRLNISLVDPTAYMKEHFENYIKEGNPVKFYLPNDDNHFNEIGSKYFAEYSYEKIFRENRIKRL